jgi:hypothetical protein
MACALATLSGCDTSNQSVNVQVHNASGVAWSAVTIVVGDDRLSWPALPAGDSIDARFMPSPEGRPELSLIYKTQASRAGEPDDQHHWAGPKQAPGQGYRIAIHVQPAGQISSRQCNKPCELP